VINGISLSEVRVIIDRGVAGNDVVKESARFSFGIWQMDVTLVPTVRIFAIDGRRHVDARQPRQVLLKVRDHKPPALPIAVALR
jgi:hypothetical protein